MRILRRDADKLGYPRDFTIYDTSDRLSIMKSIIREMDLDDKVYPPKAILARLDSARDELLSPEGFAAKYEGKMAMQCAWPEYDESKTVASHVEMAVQVLGKLKGTVTVPKDSDQQTVVDAAMALDKVQRQMDGMQIVKVIHVPNKLVNLILKPKA